MELPLQQTAGHAGLPLQGPRVIAPPPRSIPHVAGLVDGQVGEEPAVAWSKPRHVTLAGACRHGPVPRARLQYSKPSSLMLSTFCLGDGDAAARGVSVMASDWWPSGATVPMRVLPPLVVSWSREAVDPLHVAPPRSHLHGSLATASRLSRIMNRGFHRGHRVQVALLSADLVVTLCEGTTVTGEIRGHVVRQACPHVVL